MKYIAISIVIICLGVLIGAWLKRTPEQTLPPAAEGQKEEVKAQEPKGASKEEKKIIRTTMIQGMKIETVKEGTGQSVENSKIAVVHYTGKFSDGTVFDSSKTRGVPFEFMLGAGQVIKGWDLGVLGMKVGEVRLLTIPPELGYGVNGYPGAIPPNATLHFEVELVGIK